MSYEPGEVIRVVRTNGRVTKGKVLNEKDGRVTIVLHSALSGQSMKSVSVDLVDAWQAGSSARRTKDLE